MGRTIAFLPNHLRHKARGSTHQGRARTANGLMVRGVVMKTYLPDDPQAAARENDRPFAGAALSAVLCDVLVIDPEFKTYLKDVPVMTPSGGLNDHEIWVPRPSSTDLDTGNLKFSLEGSTGDTSAAHNMDGDQVVVGFLGNDANQPVIIGQFVHPKTNRRPSATDATQYKWRKYVRGMDLGVTDDGNALIDLSKANTGTITPDGSETPAAGAGGSGNMTMTMASGDLSTGAKISVQSSAVTSSPEPAMLGDTFLNDLDTFLGSLSNALSEVSTALGGLGLPVVNLGNAIAQIVTFRAQISTARTAGKPYLSSHVEHD